MKPESWGLDRYRLFGLLGLPHQDEVKGFSDEALRFGQLLREVIIRILPFPFIILVLLLNSDGVPDYGLATLVDFLLPYGNLDSPMFSKERLSAFGWRLGTGLPCCEECLTRSREPLPSRTCCKMNTVGDIDTIRQ